MRLILLGISFFMAFSQLCGAMDLGERMDLENILSNVMTTNSNTDNIIIGSPDKATHANEIIDRALWIASWNNDWGIREDNEKDEYGSLKYPLKIRKQFVDDAICRTFGFDSQKYANLSGNGRKDFDGKFYHLGGGDGGMTAKIIKTRKLENGLLKVKGEYTFGEGDEGEFTAFFAPANCGGFPHWGLRSIIYDNFEQER